MIFQVDGGPLSELELRVLYLEFTISNAKNIWYSLKFDHLVFGIQKNSKNQTKYIWYW